MLKQLVVAMMVVVLLGSLAAGAATAAPPSLAEARLVAHGDGVAALAGKGVVDLTGSGILWVHDLAGDATIQVTGYGHKEVFPDGWIQYAGFNGSAHIAGSRIRVGLAGVDVNLTATGRGEAWLWGHGTYTSGPLSGVWTTADRGTRAGY